MAIEKVRACFRAKGLEDRIREFDVSSATVELAAQAVGCEPARIGKTLSFLHEDGALLIVCAGDAKIDNSKFKGQFHHKATMLTPDQVLEFTGDIIGGVCPFAIEHSNVITYLDISLQRFTTVFPAAGSANSAVELSLSELEQCAGSAGWIDVCKGWQET